MLVQQLISGFATLILVSSSTAQAPVPVAKEPLTIQQKIVLYADDYGVDSQLLTNIISCESSMNPKALGDSGHSRGLAQIHDKYHPDISDEQAYDEDFAINYLAKNVAQGKGRMWSCFRRIKGV